MAHFKRSHGEYLQQEPQVERKFTSDAVVRETSTSPFSLATCSRLSSTETLYTSIKCFRKELPER